MRMLLMQSVSREAVAATMVLGWDSRESEGWRRQSRLGHLAEGEADVVAAEAEGIGEHHA